MCSFSHEEIVQSMIDDVISIAEAVKHHKKPKFSDALDFYDDEDSYLLDALDRWGDRKVCHRPDTYQTNRYDQKQLILEANRLLKAA